MYKKDVRLGMWVRMNSEASKYAYTTPGKIGKVVSILPAGPTPEIEVEFPEVGIAYVVSPECFDEIVRQCSNCKYFHVNQPPGKNYTECSTVIGICSDYSKYAPYEPSMTIEHTYATYTWMQRCGCATCRARREELGINVNYDTSDEFDEFDETDENETTKEMKKMNREDIYKKLGIEIIGAQNGNLLLADGRKGQVSSEILDIDINDDDVKKILAKMPANLKKRPVEIQTKTLRVQTYIFVEIDDKKNK